MHACDGLVAAPAGAGATGEPPRRNVYQGDFLSEASVYRTLKAADLITRPGFVVIQAADRFSQPTRRPNKSRTGDRALR